MSWRGWEGELRGRAGMGEGGFGAAEELDGKGRPGGDGGGLGIM